MTFSLPKEFLNTEVLIRFRDGTTMFAQIEEFTDYWVKVEGDLHHHLIPWSAISDLQISKKEKEASS